MDTRLNVPAAPVAADPDRRAPGLKARMPHIGEDAMDDHYWPLGASVLFVLITSLALWAIAALLPWALLW